MTTMRPLCNWLTLGLLALFPWAVSYFLLGGGGPDDTHITFYVARELATTGQYINYNGEALEQSSSMGLVLLLAALHALTHAPLPACGYLASMVGGSVAVVSTYALTRRLLAGSATATPAALLAAATVTTTWCLLYWSTSAMETSVAAAVAPALVSTMARYEERPQLISRLAPLLLALGLFVTIRPENVVVSGCVAMTLGVLSIRGTPRPWWRSALWLVAAPVAVTLGRLIAFDSAMPRPVSAKSGAFDWIEGLAYVWESFTASNAALFLLALAALLLASAQLARGGLSPVFAAASALLFAQLAFVVAVGGDWMAHGRFLAPAVPLASTLVAYLLASAGSRRSIWVLSVVLLVGFFQTTRSLGASVDRISFRDAARIAEAYPSLDSRFSRAEISSSSHLRDAPLVVELQRWMATLDGRIDGRIVLASGQAGMVPYYASEASEFYFIDLWGLTTADVQECAPDAIAGQFRRGALLRFDWVISGRLTDRCGLPRPDIVHGEVLTPSAGMALHQHGYRIVYVQSGAPKGKSFSKARDFGGYLAVRQDLLTQSEAEAKPTRFDWR